MDGADGRPDVKTAKLAFVGPAATMTQDLLSAPQYHGSNTLVDTPAARLSIISTRYLLHHAPCTSHRPAILCVHMCTHECMICIMYVCSMYV
jgi:hypothetical protein